MEPRKANTAAECQDAHPTAARRAGGAPAPHTLPPARCHAGGDGRPMPHARHPQTSDRGLLGPELVPASRPGSVATDAGGAAAADRPCPPPRRPRLAQATPAPRGAAGKHRPPALPLRVAIRGHLSARVPVSPSTKWGMRLDDREGRRRSDLVKTAGDNIRNVEEFPHVDEQNTGSQQRKGAAATGGRFPARETPASSELTGRPSASRRSDTRTKQEVSPRACYMGEKKGRKRETHCQRCAR